MQKKPSTVSSFSRRQVVTAATAGAAMLAMPKTGLAQDATPVDGVQPDGTWTFTDDRGVTVTLPGIPEKLVIDVNVAGSLWDFGVRPLGVIGWLSTVTDGRFPAAGGDLDPAQVENFGLPEGAIDLERLAASQPDLIVTYTFDPATEDALWSVLPDDYDRLMSIAPIVAISAVTSLPVGVARFQEFANLVGIDPEGPELAASRDEAAALETTVREALAAKPGISAIFMGPGDSEFYVASPLRARGLIYARELGLSMPDLDIGPTDFWQTLSYEQALLYPVDMLFVSTRNGIESLDEVRNHPTFSQHPAVQAGNVFPWKQDVIASYPGMMAMLNELLTGLEASDPATADEDWV